MVKNDLRSAEYDGQVIKVGSRVVARPGFNIAGLDVPNRVIRITASKLYSGGYKIFVKPVNRQLAMPVAIAVVKLAEEKA